MLLGAAVTAAWPPAMTAEEAGQERAEAPLVAGLATKVTTPPFDRLDRVVGRHGHGERVGERRADVRRLRGAAGDGREGEALALEGADVDGAEPRLRPRWSVVGMPGPLVPALMAGLPGSRAMVWVGPP